MTNYSITSYESASGNIKIYVYREKNKRRNKPYLTDRSKEYVQQKVLGYILFVLGLITTYFIGLECIIICLMGIARIIY